VDGPTTAECGSTAFVQPKRLRDSAAGARTRHAWFSTVVNFCAPQDSAVGYDNS
jgi:hypothetical protein